MPKHLKLRSLTGCAPLYHPKQAPTTTLLESLLEVNHHHFFLQAQQLSHGQTTVKTPSSDHNERDLEYVKEYPLHNDEVQQLRVLLYGPVGSGKSTFINSVESLLKGKITDRAPKDATTGESYTTKYRTYKIRKGEPGAFYPFAFTDIMGLEVGTNRGVAVEDIKLAMKGHINDGYTFNPCYKIPEDNQHYNKTPTLKDQAHVLVCVISASTVSIMSDETVRKMREVRLAARDMGIPQLAILTKIDVACPEVKKDIRNVYKSTYLKQQTDELSARLGFSPNSIFPVQNYHSENRTNDDINTLLLSALTQIITEGEEFVNNP
ncbi:interferon-induced protein 44-like isoform X1 [Sebastes fasciatus]|uniref:interferon-induced protein 44-like isoform X1 n=1 Tax=Sebastes fasciatus TaxID=394691 RepID=UPI003D9F7509